MPSTRERTGATPRAHGDSWRVVGRLSNGRISTDAVAIVTGGASAAGRELAGELALRGFAVVVVYLRDPRAAAAAVEAILAAGGVAVTVRADVADELDVARVFDETVAAFGAVDVVAHGARRGAAVVDRHAARRLRQGGAIVSVSSTAGLAPAIARQLRDRAIAVNGFPAGLEPPGPDRDVAELVALLERWRRHPVR